MGVIMVPQVLMKQSTEAHGMEIIYGHWVMKTLLSAGILQIGQLLWQSPIAILVPLPIAAGVYGTMANISGLRNLDLMWGKFIDSAEMGTSYSSGTNRHSADGQHAS